MRRFAVDERRDDVTESRERQVDFRRFLQSHTRRSGLRLTLRTLKSNQPYLIVLNFGLNMEDGWGEEVERGVRVEGGLTARSTRCSFPTRK